MATTATNNMITVILIVGLAIPSLTDEYLNAISSKGKFGKRGKPCNNNNKGGAKGRGKCLITIQTLYATTAGDVATSRRTASLRMCPLVKRRKANTKAA